ncbi:hypothetical protein WKI71_26495 [Streptomyces sp. MS1.AVA.1]|uniref:Glycosyltransferase family 4 protein n=1 Tax=Streptomyces machairae TaxID=3134109 RepID=A0ABU8UP35_9ACTN
MCTDSCGIADELAHRGAAMVTDGSPEALADAVCGVLADDAKRDALVAAGHRAVREAFSIHAVTDRLEAIYRGACHAPLGISSRADDSGIRYAVDPPARSRTRSR